MPLRHHAHTTSPGTRTPRTPKTRVIVTLNQPQPYFYEFRNLLVRRLPASGAAGDRQRGVQELGGRGISREAEISRRRGDDSIQRLVRRLPSACGNKYGAHINKRHIRTRRAYASLNQLRNHATHIPRLDNYRIQRHTFFNAWLDIS